MLTVVTNGTDTVEAGTVVKRTVGFGRDGFVAEVTVKVGDGFATVRAEALSADFALMKAKLAAREKMSARPRATGFTATGFRATSEPADYFGFTEAA